MTVLRWFKGKEFLRLQFYNRLMLINILIFLLIASGLAFTASRYALNYYTMKQLQQNKRVLNELNDYYRNKQREFLNLVFTLYDTNDTYNTFSKFLDNPSDTSFNNNPFAKQAVVRILDNISIQDRDIVAILIYKTLTGARYVYTPGRDDIEQVGPEYPFFKQLASKKSGRFIYGSQMMPINSSKQWVNGISGTLGSKTIKFQAGQLFIAFDTSMFDSIIKKYNSKTLGRFIIASDNGNVIFDSAHKYNHLNLTHFKIQEPHITINHIPYYTQTIRNSSRNYYITNLVPEKQLYRNSIYVRLLIYGVFALMVLVCIILYTVSGTFVSRRVNILLRGMKRIGSNDLSYRIPLFGGRDEFNEIATHFNTMCEELQQTINREYVNELMKKKSELQALQSGINPHFLYNTLEAIRIKAAEDDNYEVSEMIMLLSRLYRNILKGDTFVSIHKELTLCSMYMSLFSLRYSSLLDYEIHVDPAIREYGIPKNLLQPIIENYFVHGIRLVAEDNRFTIRGIQQADDIYFFFEDNGRGFKESQLQEVLASLNGGTDPDEGSSYGLPNVHERIQLVYGKQYGLSIESKENVGTRVIVHIRALQCRDLAQSIKPEGLKAI